MCLLVYIIILCIYIYLIGTPTTVRVELRSLEVERANMERHWKTSTVSKMEELRMKRKPRMDVVPNSIESENRAERV